MFKFRRLCKAVGATPLPKMTAPTSEELGYADRVYVDELGDTSVVVFRLDAKESPIATVVVRGSTDNYMDDIERAVDDGVNTFKVRGFEMIFGYSPRAAPQQTFLFILLRNEQSEVSKSFPGLSINAVSSSEPVMLCFD